MCFAAWMRKHKSYCTPEAYRGATCWLFRNRGNGTFEDVTAKSGIFDSSSKSLGVAMLDYDQDGWIDLMVANDTQPNKLYRNQRDGTFQDIAVKAGVAFSEDGKARAGMGVDAADYDNSGIAGLAITNFDNEMIGFYRGTRGGLYVDQAARSDVGRLSRRSLGFGCFFFDADLDGLLDLLVVNGHIDPGIRETRPETGYAQPPHLFLNKGSAGFHDVAGALGGGFADPKVGRGAAFGDFDRDGDLDVLITTNQGPGLTIPQRSVERPSRHPLPAGGYQVEPRRYRRDGAGDQRRGNRIAHGQERLQLFVAIGDAGDIRAGQAGYASSAPWCIGRAGRWRSSRTCAPGGCMSAWKGRACAIPADSKPEPQMDTDKHR